MLQVHQPFPREQIAPIRWPENVILTGDARAFRDLTTQYEREYRERKKVSGERREAERRRVFEKGW